VTTALPAGAAPIDEQTAPSGSTADPALLWIRFSDDLRRYIARRVDRPEDVEDVLQTVFVRIQLGLGSLRDDDRLLGWIYTLTRNAITDHYRRASTRRELPVGELPPESHRSHEPVEEPVAVSELAGCLRPMLARLPPEQAAALELVELQGVSQGEAARRTGISLSGMKARVQRGRARLRAQLLDCCSVRQDARGAVRDFALRGDGCGGGCDR
jgi:RNA polymerase sigma-70 factor (ECF subfamily)